MTQLGQFLGTPDYISPEQAQDTRTADIRSDIFSLGCTFFRMLTGELPFAGESVVQKLESRATTDARRARSLRHDVSPELDNIIARMLSRVPAARYQTPRDVAQALAPFVRRVAPLPSRPREACLSEGVPRASGEDSRLEEFFRSLATEEAPSLSVSGLALRLKRIAPRFWLAAAGLAGVVAVALVLWYRLGTAEVAVVWPTDERQGAELRVNQRLVKLSASETVPISGRPATWEFRLVREGYETFEKIVTVRRGERLELTPEWRPTPLTFRRLNLQKLERLVAAASPEEPSAPSAIALRAELLTFLRQYPTTAEAGAARKLAARLRWPLDQLDGAGVHDGDWQLPPAIPSDASPLKPVGLFGDGRLKFWNTITAIAVSGDGTLLAGASRDGTVQVFDPTDGRRRQIIVPPSPPADLLFSPSGALLAIAGTSGPVTLWNAGTGALAASLPEGFGPMAFSGSGGLIAVRAARQEIALWDATNGELRRTMQGHSSGVLRGLVFSHNGKMLATYGSDSSVLLWDVASGQERRRFSSAEIPLFSLDDAFLAAGAGNGDLILWDTRTGETQRTLDDGGYPLAFLPGGVALISKRQGRAVEWNLATGEEIRTIVDVPVLATVSPDGKWLAGGDESFGEVRLWDLQRGASRRALSTLGPVTALAFSPDSSSIVVGTREQVLQTFAVQAGAERTLADLPLGPADLGPDSEVLALRRGDRIDLVDLPTGKPRRTLAGKSADLEALVFSPDGSFVAGFGGWGFLQTSLRLWESSSGRELSLAGEPLGNVRTMAFSIDSRLLACAGDSRLVTLWDLTRQKVRQTLDDFSDRVTALAFHPDGRRLAVACQDQTLVLWDVKAGSVRTLARKTGACRQLVFSGDGRLLAGTSDEHVLVWDLEREKSRAELPTGDGSPTSIAFDPAGTTLAAAGTDGLLRLWNDPARGGLRDESERLIRVGPSHGVVKRVLWSPDGRHVLTVNGNGTIYVYRVSLSVK